ncbi:type II and III secretion system protein family protein [Qipengyuania sp. 6B39]|uniref:type II and III secretion system protein family protein n=1 Tax=Qipengyuania proteolytica TaxID=2867239 RepID=UPI001C8A41A9|nr:type II and III secretion system protein family protein [Qipengyuania proteolytica]MBX7496686.1 type II and III secretion system protein family protein [Qipengyuania proteolytica]
MKRRLSTKMLLASLALAPLASIPANVATAQSVARPSSEIVLSIGRGELVTVPGAMANVFVADEKIADVQVKSTRQLYVFGKSGGETTVYASNSAGDIVWSANIRVGSNIGSIDQMLTLAMPEAKVNVATMGTNTVLLTGTVGSPEDASEAQRLVEAFVGEGTNVISRLRMATPLQVNLQVRFAEVSRTLVRDISANLTTRDSSNGFVMGAFRGNPGNIVGDDPSSAIVPLDPCDVFRISCTSQLRPYDIINQRFVTTETRFEPAAPTNNTLLNAGGRLLGLDLLATLDLGERIGLVTTISEPNLTALSGETAEFLAGGEFPIPQSQGLGTTSVEYKNYGVSLTYTPTVLSNGRISIRVRPEVSELTSRGAVTLNGFSVPALTTRRAETTVELGSGQSFMIAGLMQNSSQNSLEKTPGLGDVPILGNLFRSKSYQKGETELVIIVTPYLVKPVNASDIVLPTDGFRAPNEIQSIVGYMENNGQSGERRPVPTMQDSTQPATPGISQAAPAGGEATASRGPANPRRAEADVDAKPGFSFE